MKVLIITTGANPLDGGFSLRVHGMAQMASRVADVSVLSTYDRLDPKIPGVKFYHRRFGESIFSKIGRLATYYRTSFERIAFPEKFDVVQVEHPALFGLVRSFPGVPVVLDEHNVWWELEAYNMGEGPTIRNLPFKKPVMSWLLSRAKKYELSILDSSSHVITCSTADKEKLLDERPGLKNRISYIPNCLDIARYDASQNEDNVVLFMGSLLYYPNIDAVRLICEKIAPRVNAEFQILGEGTVNVKAPSNVKFMGRVNDVRPYVGRAKVCIAPLRYGSGSRLKILEYMAMGKAVVSTAKGAEGLEVTPDKNIIIENDMSKFRDWVDTLLKDDPARAELGAYARFLVETQYDYNIYCKTIKTIYEAVA